MHVGAWIIMHACGGVDILVLQIVTNNCLIAIQQDILSNFPMLLMIIYADKLTDSDTGLLLLYRKVIHRLKVCNCTRTY